MEQARQPEDLSINFLDKIKEFVKQEKDCVLQKYNAIESAYTEAFLTIQKVDEKRTAD